VKGAVPGGSSGVVLVRASVVPSAKRSNAAKG